MEASEELRESTTISMEEREEKAGKRELRTDEKSSMLMNWKSRNGQVTVLGEGRSTDRSC